MSDNIVEIIETPNYIATVDINLTENINQLIVESVSTSNIEISNGAETSDYTITIDTNLAQNDNGVIVETSSPNTIEIIDNDIILVGDLPYGYPLDWTTGNLPISRLSGLDILGGSGISVVDNSGIYTISLQDPINNGGITDLLESVQDIIGNSGLIGGDYIKINYNDTSGFTTISATGLQPSGNYSLVGHNHNTSDINNFNSAVSGLILVKNISSGSGISISNNSGDFTVAVTGSFGLTSEQVDDRISNLLLGSTYITLDYDDDLNALTIGTSGLQPSGNYSIVGHSHAIADVSGLQNALDSKQPSGSYALSIHNHTVSDITNFSSGVNALVSGVYAPLISPSFSGTPTVPTAPSGTNSTQIASTAFVRNEISNLIDSAPNTLDTLNELASALNDDANFATTIASGLANKAPLVHTHVVNDITNFNSGVSGLLPITNITGSSGVLVSNSGTIYNISSTGLAFTSGANFNSLSVSGVSVSVSGHKHSYSDIINFASGVDQTVSTLLLAGSYININYDNIYDTLTINATGLQPSGNYANSVHSHGNISSSGTIGSTSGLLVTTTTNGVLTTSSGISSNYITNLNSSVSGLLPSVTGTGYVSLNFANNIYSISVTGLQPSGNYSLVGHSHTSSNISDFNSSVSGLLPVKNINGSGYINVSNSSGNYTISVSGLQPSGNYANAIHTHQGDDITIVTSTEDFGTLYAGSNAANFLYKLIDAGPIDGFEYLLTDNIPIPNNYLPIATASGLGIVRPGSGVFISSGIISVNTNYSPLSHNHTSSNITDFNSSVSGLLPVKNINGSGYINVANNSGIYTISVAGLQPSGNYANSVHSHSISDITNFNSGVSGLLPSISGSGYIISNFSNNNYTISVSGLQPSGNYSLVGHTHPSSEITDFNSAVSGLIPVKNIFGGNGVSVSSVSGEYTISASGVAAGSAESILTNCFNNTGSTLSKGTVVYINGRSGNLPTVQKSIATNEAGSSKTYGILFEDITDNHSGRIIVIGALTDFDTNQFSAPEGSTLYLSPSVSGAMTATKPIAPNHLVSLGKIIRNHNNQGIIQVAIQNGFELEELHNVAISGATSGQFLQYNGSGLWTPSSSGNFSTLTVNNINVSTSGHSHTSSDITDFASSVSNLLPTISNSGNYRILTSTGSNTGINAESNLTFDGTTLGINTNNIADVALSISGNSPILSIAGGSVPFISIQGTDGSVLYFNGNNGDASIVCSNSYNPTIPGAVLEALEIVSNSGILIDAGNNILFRSPNVPQWLNTSIPAVIPISISGHAHTSSDITNFNNSVSGLLPITNIAGGSNITVSQSGTTYTIAVTGSLGLTTEEVDDRISNLLVSGTGINLNYDDNLNILTVSTTGLQPSGNYANASHTHTSSNITDFASSVSGLLPVTNILSGTNISVTPSGSSYTISVSGSLGLTTEEVDDRVSSLLVAGTGIALNYNDNANSLTISAASNRILSDFVGSTNYIGLAPVGSATSSSVWTIRRTIYTSGGAVSSNTTATNVKWDDRLTATYI